MTTLERPSKAVVEHDGSQFAAESKATASDPRRLAIGLHFQGALAILSVSAAVIHFSAMGEHSSVSWQHAVFFAVIAWFQLMFAAAVLLRPSKPALAFGLLLNAGIIGVWAVSRTAGISIGGAGGVEPVGFADVVATVIEGITVVGALALFWTGTRTHPWTKPAVRWAMVGVGVIALPLASVGFTPAFAAASGHQHGVGGAIHNHGTPVGVLTGNTPCEKSGPPASEGQVLGGHGHLGPVQQIPLDQATTLQLQQQQEQARAVVQRYPTVADAVRAGYGQSTVYVPCIGAHYTNVGLAVQFNPAAPSELLYDGTAPTSKLVGLSYLVYHPGGPPPGFAGPNDRWHQHTVNGGLCLKGGLVVGAESTSAAACAALGGVKDPLTDIWMLHDWVVPGFECSWGVFAGECPELGGRLGASAWAS